MNEYHNQKKPKRGGEERSRRRCMTLDLLGEGEGMRRVSRVICVESGLGRPQPEEAMQHDEGRRQPRLKGLRNRHTARHAAQVAYSALSRRKYVE